MKKKMIVYSLALALVVLGLAGTAFAHWTKVITVSGYVKTGTVDWIWDEPLKTHISDQGPDQYRNPNTWAIIQGTKDVAQAKLEKIDDDNLVMTITNAYPMYMSEFSLHAHYLGSVPGIVRSVLIKDCQGNVVADLSYGQPFVYLKDAAGVNVFKVDWDEPPTGWQIHYCKTWEISFKITALEPIVMDKYSTLDPEYCYHFEFEVINYNEYPYACNPWPDPTYVPPYVPI